MFRSLAVSLLLVVSAGCASIRPSAPVLMPLAEGSRWEYRDVDLRTGAETARLYYRIRGSRLVGGEPYAVLESSSDSTFAEAEVALVRNEAGGLVFAVEDATTGTVTHRFVLHFPVLPGNAFTARYPSGEEVRYTVARRKVRVPAGRFRTHAYASCDESGIEARDYYAPGVGLVRVDLPEARWELAAYVIGGGTEEGKQVAGR